MKPADLLCARLKDTRFDISRLRQHYESVVAQTPATPYRDNRVDYLGWAITSRDGSTQDGVRRIDSKLPGGKRGVEKTALCTGYLSEVIDHLEATGLKPYRARTMKLESEGIEMPLHTDATTETWRLHVPIITNEHSFFEWERENGEIASIHLPADGSAWLVRVDVRHRAVNRSQQPCERVHLLMGLSVNPEPATLAGPWVFLALA
jgi:hypothetical protein